MIDHDATAHRMDDGDIKVIFGMSHQVQVSISQSALSVTVRAITAPGHSTYISTWTQEVLLEYLPFGKLP